MMVSELNQLDDLSIPEDIDAIAYKAELFLVRAMGQRARQFWSEVSRTVKCPESLTLAEFYEKLHFRVCSMAFYKANLQLMETLLDDIEEEAHDHPTYQLFRHLHWHYSQADMGLCFFPLNVWYSEADAGPHLHPEIDHQSWGAGRIDEINEGEIQARMVEFKDGRRVKTGLVAIPIEVLPSWGSDTDPSDLEEGDYFELYEIEGKDYPLIRWWGRDWDGWKDLPPLATDPLRYLRKEGWVRGGDTFMERAVRNEVTLDDLEADIEEWRRGQREKSKAWTLADHLGLLPEEYQTWVETREESYLLALIEERRQLWDNNRNIDEKVPILYS